MRDYGFTRGLYELTLRAIGVETRDKKMEALKKDLIMIVRNSALEYGLNPVDEVVGFMNFEAKYLYNNHAYTINRHKINDLSKYSCDVYTRYMRMKAK